MNRKPIRPILPHPLDPTLALVQLTKGYFAVISVVDAAEIGRFNWSALVDKTTVYARRSVKNPDKDGPRQKELMLHREVARLMGLDVSAEVDHRNGNGLDCRRSEIRAATRFQNMANVPLRKNNRSGVRGVSWMEECGKWRARITVRKKMLHLGLFDDLKTAEDVVVAARLFHFGAFGQRQTEPSN